MDSGLDKINNLHKLYKGVNILFISACGVFFAINFLQYLNGVKINSNLPLWVFFSLFVFFAAIFIVCQALKNSFTYYLQPSVIFLVGLVSLLDQTSSGFQMGYVFCLLAMFLITRYKVNLSSNIIFYIISIFLIIVASLFGSYVSGERSSFFFIKSIFTHILFFSTIASIFIFTGLKTVVENQKMSEQLIKELHWRNIGKEVFTSFIHDYNSTDIYVAGLKVKETLKKNKPETAEKFLDIQLNMIQHLNKKYENIRDIVILSQKKEKEKINIFRLLNNRFNNDVNFIADNKELELYLPLSDFYSIYEPIILNSLQATKTKPVIYIKDEESIVSVNIENDGDKIPWAMANGKVKNKDFFPGKTTKEHGSGWGVYSSIIAIERHKGKMLISSNDRKTSFCIKMPKAVV